MVIWRKAKFECPDCLTKIEITTSLPETFKPFRMACPCKYSGLHRIQEWENISWDFIFKTWDKKSYEK